MRRTQVQRNREARKLVAKPRWLQRHMQPVLRPHCVGRVKRSQSDHTPCPPKQAVRNSTGCSALRTCSAPARVSSAACGSARCTRCARSRARRSGSNPCCSSPSPPARQTGDSEQVITEQRLRMKCKTQQVARRETPQEQRGAQSNPRGGGRASTVSGEPRDKMGIVRKRGEQGDGPHSPASIAAPRCPPQCPRARS